MAVLQRNQINIRNIGETVTVPNNDVARLMYYFDCVCYAIEYTDSDMQRFRNYHNWSSLSYTEIRLLVALCYTLSPDVFVNKVFFQSDALCGNTANKFFEISQISHQLLAVQSIVIAGRRRRVNRIMTYTMAWMRKNYLDPMRRLA